METQTKIIIAVVIIVIIIIVIVVIVVLTTTNIVTTNVTTMSISDINALYNSAEDSSIDYDISGGNYYIKNYGSSLFLSVSDNTLSAQLETTTKWDITFISIGVYTISNIETPSTFLTSMGDGKSVQLLESNVIDAQKWYIHYLIEKSTGSNSIFAIVPLSTLTSTLSTSDNNVIQSVFTNANTEKWFISTGLDIMV